MHFQNHKLLRAATLHPSLCRLCSHTGTEKRVWPTWAAHFQYTLTPIYRIITPRGSTQLIIIPEPRLLVQPAWLELDSSETKTTKERSKKSKAHSPALTLTHRLHRLALVRQACQSRSRSNLSPHPSQSIPHPHPSESTRIRVPCHSWW